MFVRGMDYREIGRLKKDDRGAPPKKKRKKKKKERYLMYSCIFFPSIHVNFFILNL